LLSVTTFCLETLPEFTESESPQYKIISIIEVTCTIWFTVEFFLRALTCPDRLKFARDVMNWIDLCAILPFFISAGLSESVKSIVVLRIMRLIRVIRILKLSRHSIGLQILGHTLKASCRELCLLVFFLSIGVIIFSSLIYYAEKDVDNTKFTSIPTSFWWSIVTMTTIGYGDVVPQTFQGKFIGALCALCGVLVVALPVPVVVSNFSLYYSYAQSKFRSNEKNSQSCDNIDRVSHLHTWFNPGVTHRSSMISNASRNSWYIATPYHPSPPKPSTPQLCFDNYSPISTGISWQHSLPSSPLFRYEAKCGLEKRQSTSSSNHFTLNEKAQQEDIDKTPNVNHNELRIPSARKPTPATHFDFSRDKLQKRLNLTRRQQRKQNSSHFLTPALTSCQSSCTASPVSSYGGLLDLPLSSTSGFSEPMTSSTIISSYSASQSFKASPNLFASQKQVLPGHQNRRRSSEELNVTPRTLNSFRESWSQITRQTRKLQEVSKKLENYVSDKESERVGFKLSPVEKSYLHARRKARKSAEELVLPTFTLDGPTTESLRGSLSDGVCNIVPVSPKVLFHKSRMPVL